MTFRARVLLASVVVAVAPVVVLTLGIRHEVEKRLTAEYRARADALTAVIRDDLGRSGDQVDARLDALAAGIGDDARVRAAALRGGEQPDVLDWAGHAMPLAGLDYLMLVDSSGRILSSGHFRNEYGRRAAVVDSLLGRPYGPVLVRARTAEGTFLTLARARRLELGGRRFALAGGITVDSGFLNRLARGGEAGGLAVDLLQPEDTAAAPPAGVAVSADLALPYLDDTTPLPALDTARIVVTHSLSPLAAVLRGMDAWFLAGAVAALLLAVVIARALSARVTRPLTELASKTRRVDLERLDVDFRSTRRDEVGSLARLMAAMVERLRASVAQLRRAERRAAVGDMARQVNHDIRNGLLPIRNVIRHLAEVAEGSPAELAPVFAERQGTLDGGIAYLEGLASTYARLSPRADRRPCDVNEVARAVVRDVPVPEGVSLRAELDEATARVSADPIVLRRIVENLVVNALESLEGGGSVVVSTGGGRDMRGPTVTLAVADTGRGMDAEAVERIFEDFFSTKPDGTGLGLSIVRRLVTDLGGRIDVDSTPGRGSRFQVELPGLEPPDRKKDTP